MNDPHPGNLTRRRLLRQGLTLASAACASSLSATGRLVALDASAEQAFTVGNDIFQRVVAFHPGAGLYTRALSCLATKTEYLPANQAYDNAAPEFSFQANGELCAANAGFTLLVGEQSATPNGRVLTVRLRHMRVPLEVTVVYTVYAGHAASRKHLEIRNTGSAPVRLTHLAIETLQCALGPTHQLTLMSQYGTVPREIFYTGRSEDAGIFIANGLTHTGIAVLSEVPGYMKRTEITGWDEPDRIGIRVLYDTDLMPFARTIGPGETFATAAVSLVTFRHGDGFHDPRWTVPRYAAQVLERRVDRRGAPWIYNTWEPFERTIKEATVLELIDAASAMDMDIFTIDDGWQQEYGDNAVNLTAFPRGLEPILSAVEAKGMRLGLWIPLAAIGAGTQVHRDHPEWAALEQDGRPKFTETAAGQKPVMCLACAFRESAAERVMDAIERFRLAYVKLDLTTIFNAYGEAPGCWAKNHDHRDWAESLVRIYEGIRYVTGRVYEKHPEVLLDLTFELWGQKHIIDAGLLAAGDLDWMSNVDDRHPDSAGPRQARQLLYARAASMPVESMLIGNLHGELPTIEESFATAMGSAPVLLGDLRKLTTADRAWYHEKIGWFKQLRGRAALSESFFPLGSWQQVTPAAWDGYARLARSGDGLIALFRNESNVKKATVQLGPLPEGSYRLHSVMTGRDLPPATREAFVRGVEIPFPGRVEVLEVRHIG
jgi:alpha-galactosidase